MPQIWITSDTHFCHLRIIAYAFRPFFNQGYSKYDLISFIDSMDGNKKPDKEKLSEIVDLRSHDQCLLDNWNSVVSPQDTVYHLGDFGFGDFEFYLKRLNGKIILIKGNHDKSINKFSRYFSYIYKEPPVNSGVKIKNEKVVLSHYPMLSWRRSYYALNSDGPVHCFGHIHSDGSYNLNGPFIKHPSSCDAGVDAWEYKPVSLEQIKERILKQKNDFFNKYPYFKSGG